MKVLVTGSRVYGDYDKVKQAIIDSGATIIVEGEASGADTLAKQAGHELGLEVREYAARWDLWGKSAGTRRNQEMLDKEHAPQDPIDLVLAFPVVGSKGTWDMVKRAEKAGIKVKVF